MNMHIRQVTMMTSLLSQMCSWLPWIILITFTEFAGVSGEICMYQKSKYNPLESQYEKVMTQEDCRWGCCNYRSTACCGPPVTLIVGCTLGGAFVLAIVVIFVCCCCLCRGQGHASDLARQDTQSTQANSVVFTSSMSGNPCNSGAPAIPLEDAPPSYEDVMRGQDNQAFKPDD